MTRCVKCVSELLIVKVLSQKYLPKNFIEEIKVLKEDIFLI